MENFENLFLVKSKMADNRPKCKSSVGFRPHSNFGRYRFELEQDVKSDSGLTHRWPTFVVFMFGLVRSTTLWVSMGMTSCDAN